MILKISHLAERDLEEIWLYTREVWSVEQADRYTQWILDAMERLRIHPTRGQDYGTIRPGYWRAKVKSHVLFYRIEYASDQMEIIRVLHEKRDIEPLL